jgi:hypothetical protein
LYFCHQNQNAKNIGNVTTPLKLHNIGTHLKGIEMSRNNLIFADAQASGLEQEPTAVQYLINK